MHILCCACVLAWQHLLILTTNTRRSFWISISSELINKLFLYFNVNGTSHIVLWLWLSFEIEWNLKFSLCNIQTATVEYQKHFGTVYLLIQPWTREVNMEQNEQTLWSAVEVLPSKWNFLLFVFQDRNFYCKTVKFFFAQTIIISNTRILNSV